MRRHALLTIASAALLGAAGCAGSPDAAMAGAKGGGFVSLFNGRDLTGWVQVLDSPWVVEDGALVSRQNPHGRFQGESWLLTARDYRDFQLRARFRITPGGNSGIFIRDPLPRGQRLAAPLGDNPPWDAGYEVNINNDEPVYPTGSVWALAKGPPKLQREGEWNDLEIRIEGGRIWTRVNGTVALDGVSLPPRSGSGAIGFQRHGGAQYRDKVIEFKDIAIREQP